MTWISGVAKGGARGSARPPNLPKDDSPDLPKSGEFFVGVGGRDSDGFRYKTGSSAPLLGLIWRPF